MKFLEYLKNFKSKPYVLIGIVVIILVSVILILYFRQSKKQSNVQHYTNINNDIILNQVESNPTMYDPVTGSIMTSPDFIPQQIEPAWNNKPLGNNTLESGTVTFESATNMGDKTMAFNKCSKSCCSNQYPLPFNMPVDKEVGTNLKNFVPNSYTCNNSWEDAGCLCMTQNQSDALAQRGGNVL